MKTPFPHVPFAFGPEFQMKLVKVLVQDIGVTDAILRYVRPEYFEAPPLRWAIQMILNYKEKYNSIPTTAVLQEEARSLDPSLRVTYSQFLHQIHMMPIPEEQWIKDQVLAWVKRNIFAEAHARSKNLFNAGSVDEAYDAMRLAVNEIDQTVWSKVDRGWLFDDVSDRENQRGKAKIAHGRVSCGIHDIDKMLGGGAEPGFFGVWMAYSKGGKALADDEPVLTPSGFRPISTLVPGDLVIGGSTGQPCEVLGVFPQGAKECYRVTFSDGASVVASGDHIWTVADIESDQRRDPWFETTTKGLLDKKDAYQGKPWIPLVPPIQMPEMKLSLDPYLLGLLLGDGCLRNRTITFCKPEEDLFEAIAGVLPEGDVVHIHQEGRYISIVRPFEPLEPSATLKRLEELGLFGCLSKNKFVPKAYLAAHEEARWNLLCGLCDTDGHVTQHGCVVEFSSASEELAEDVQWLVRSLGGIARIRRKTVNQAYYWIVRLRFVDGRMPVRSQKNMREVRVPTRRVHRRVQSIVPVGLRSCTCITVSDPESLFITRDFIVTHNSIMLQNNGLAAARSYKRVLHIVLEGNRSLIEDRYDAAFASELYQLTKRGDMNDAKYASLSKEYKRLRGLMVIRGFTDRWDVSITDIQAEMDDLRKNYGWKPHVLIIDYGDLLSSRKQYKSSWESDREAYRDMKSLANRGHVVWTASQVQRPQIKEHLTKEHLLTSKDIAGGFDKIRVCDFAGSLNSTLDERDRKVMRILPEVVRDAPGGKYITIGADFGTMRFGIPIKDPTAKKEASASPTLGYKVSEKKAG